MHRDANTKRRIKTISIFPFFQFLAKGDQQVFTKVEKKNSKSKKKINKKFQKLLKTLFPLFFFFFFSSSFFFSPFNHHSFYIVPWTYFSSILQKHLWLCEFRPFRCLFPILSSISLLSPPKVLLLPPENYPPHKIPLLPPYFSLFNVQIQTKRKRKTPYENLFILYLFVETPFFFFHLSYLFPFFLLFYLFFLFFFLFVLILISLIFH